MNAFLLALQLLTTAPITTPLDNSGEQLGRSSLFYPAIGLLLGGLLLAFAHLTSFLPLAVQAVLVLAVWVLATGGLHLDGLADSADAWVGGMASKQRTLAIMKDPTLGTMAVLALVLVLLLKATLIAACLNGQLSALLWAPPLARAGLLGLMANSDYRGNLASPIIANLPASTANALSVAWLAAAVWFVGVPAIIALILVMFAVRALAYRRLGGVTGDIYGAAVELAEVAILLAVVW